MRSNIKEGRRELKKIKEIKLQKIKNEIEQRERK